MSSIYLSYLNKQSHAQQLSTNTNFMSKHKISVNTPAQAHYTVQGVQLYAPQQIKALKQKQDRLMQGKNGIYAQTKVYLLSDQIMDDETDAYEQNKQKKNKTKQKKERVQSANPSKKRQVKTSVNTRNAVSTNNQVIVKLEKQMTKRNSLESQLEKMANKYKQHFKIEEKSKTGDNKYQQLQQSEIIQDQQPTSNRPLSNDNVQNLSQNQEISKTSKTTKNASSTTKNQPNKLKKNQKLNTQNENKNKNKALIKNTIKQNIQQNSQIVQFSQQQEQQNKSKSKSNLSLNLNLGLDLINKSTTYSQKLGTAIFQMFK